MKKLQVKKRMFDLTGKTPLVPAINELSEDFLSILVMINKIKKEK